MNVYVRYTGKDFKKPSGRWFSEWCNEDYYPEIKFKVSSFENGIATVDELYNNLYKHEYVLELFIACISDETYGFKEALREAYGLPENESVCSLNSDLKIII